MNLKKAKLENLEVCKCKIQDIGKVTSGLYYLPKNVMFKSDKLITRPGAFPYDELIFDSENTYNLYAKTIFTDCYYYKEGKKGRVFIIVDDDEFSTVTYHFFIMWSDGHAQNIGKIDFTRASETTFGKPESFILYKGKATRGCGLYFFTRLVYENGEEDFVKMYELNANMTSWENVYSNDFYIPTILAFGRGEKYYLAEEEDKRISFSKPVRPESENILTDVFFAYYTTDGYSSAFELPHNNISDAAISCVYSDLANEYSFSIGFGKNQSSTVVINSRNYRFCCNRTLGTVYFTDEAGTKTALPFVGVENNLKITASRKESDDLVKLAAMSKCMQLPAGREGKGGQTVIFYGNTLDEGGKIYWINSEKPLYFPKSCIATPGNLSNKLEGAYTFKDKLYMYDKENIYSASVHTSKNYDLSLILKGVSSINEVGTDNFTFNQVIKLPQEITKDTVVVFPNKVLFVGKSGELYEHGDSSGSIKRIADISANNFLPDFAVSYKGGYLAFKGRDAYYYDLLNDRLSFWDLITDVFSGFSFSDECILFAEQLCKGNRRLVYALRFVGKLDGLILDFTNKPSYVSTKVQARVNYTFPLDDAFYKHLYSLILDTDIKEDKVYVNIFADKKTISNSFILFTGGPKTIRRGARFKRLEISLVGEDLAFNGAKIIYCDGKVL